MSAAWAAVIGTIRIQQLQAKIALMSTFQRACVNALGAAGVRSEAAVCRLLRSPAQVCACHADHVSVRPHSAKREPAGRRNPAVIDRPGRARTRRCRMRLATRQRAREPTTASTPAAGQRDRQTDRADGRRARGCQGEPFHGLPLGWFELGPCLVPVAAHEGAGRAVGTWTLR